MKNKLIQFFTIFAIALFSGSCFFAADRNNPNDPERLSANAGGGDSIVSISRINGVTPPAYGETPVTTITETEQYTGIVSWSGSPLTFDAVTVYTATITLKAKSGYTLSGVTSDFFTVAGATNVTNIADSGVVTAVFPETGAVPPTVIDIAAISGVTPPAAGDTPVTTIIETIQYTGVVSWWPADNPFDYSKEYMATITLTPKSGYTLFGITENFFTVAEATTVTNDTDSGVVTAVFPTTDAAPPTVISIAIIDGVTPPAYGETPVTTIAETGQYTGNISWSGSPVTFGADTVYTATIVLTAKPGYTFTGVSANFFTVAGSTTDTNEADSGVVTVVFPITGNPGPAAGDTETYTADGVSFLMAYVPGGLTFPTGIDDDNTATVDNAYWIGETEVTWEIWSKVYEWAVNGTGTATGEGDYTFANSGGRGGYYTDDNYSYTTGHETHPVTQVSWDDCIVWCNALTEWYNAKKGTTYGCVYTYNSSIVRNSSNTTACDSVVVSSTERGFRLLTSTEWELAARYRGTDTTNVVTGEIGGIDFDVMTIKWTKGDSASGDTQAYNVAPENYAIYSGNSSSSTAAIKTRNENALNVYDMSGNVDEWCSLSNNKIIKTGAWSEDASYLQIGKFEIWNGPGTLFNNSIGFRFARTAN